MLRLFPKIGVSIVFTIEFVVLVVHLTCISGRFVYSCSQPFPFGLLFPRTSDGQPFFIRLHRAESLRLRKQHVEFSHPLLLKLTWPRSHCLVTLLYSAAKKARLILHDASSGGTIAILAGRANGGHGEGYSRVSRGMLFSPEKFQKTLCDPFGCTKETRHLQLEPWTPSGKRRCFRTTKLSEGGISLPCKRRLTTMTTSFSRVASTWPIMQAARFSSIRTLSTPTSMSSPSTFMTQDAICPIKSWKENRDGSSKVFFHVPFFRPPRVSGQKYFTVLSLHISNMYARKRGIAKKLILTFRAVMISQEVDLVAGDFNGTAWQYRGKDNLSTIDEACMDSILRTPRGPTPLWGPGSILDNRPDVCGFLKPPGSQRFWKVNKRGAFSMNQILHVRFCLICRFYPGCQCTLFKDSEWKALVLKYRHLVPRTIFRTASWITSTTNVRFSFSTWCFITAESCRVRLWMDWIGCIVAEPTKAVVVTFAGQLSRSKFALYCVDFPTVRQHRRIHCRQWNGDLVQNGNIGAVWLQVCSSGCAGYHTIHISRKPSGACSAVILKSVSARLTLKHVYVPCWEWSWWDACLYRPFWRLWVQIWRGGGRWGPWVPSSSTISQHFRSCRVCLACWTTCPVPQKWWRAKSGLF